jgi:hypothetical protein
MWTYRIVLPGRGDMAGGMKPHSRAKGEEARVEPHQVAFMFGDCGCEIIEPQFSSTAAQGFKGREYGSARTFRRSGCV